MVGVTETELQKILNYFIEDSSKVKRVSEEVKLWYNGYCFNTNNQEKDKYIYNSLWYYLDPYYYEYHGTRQFNSDPNIKNRF